MSGGEETIASEVLSASLGGAISASILYPLELLKTKMQAVDSSNSEDKEEEGNKSMIPFAIKLYKEQGPEVFWRGMETSAFQSALEKALYFFAYTSLKEGYQTATGGKRPGTFASLALGCAAEWAHLPVTLPVDAWTTRIQTGRDAPVKVLLSMLSDRDASFYKGISAYTVLCFKPALQYTVYEQVKRVLLRGRTSLSSAEAFVLGMVARTVATVMVFPCLRAKVLMQTQKKSSEGAANHQSMLQIVLQQWKEQGLLGLYQGIGPELTRGIFSAALMLMIKERITGTVRLLLARRSATKQLSR